MICICIFEKGFPKKERAIVEGAVFSDKIGFDRVLVKMSRVKLPFFLFGLREDPPY